MLVVPQGRASWGMFRIGWEWVLMHVALYVADMGVLTCLSAGLLHDCMHLAMKRAFFQSMQSRFF